MERCPAQACQSRTTDQHLPQRADAGRAVEIRLGGIDRNDHVCAFSVSRPAGQPARGRTDDAVVREAKAALLHAQRPARSCLRELPRKKLRQESAGRFSEPGTIERLPGLSLARPASGAAPRADGRLHIRRARLSLRAVIGRIPRARTLRRMARHRTPGGDAGGAELNMHGSVGWAKAPGTAFLGYESLA